MSDVLLSKENRVAVLTLNRPPANALSSSILDDLAEHFTALENDSEVKAIIVRGDGRFFSAGADIKEFTEIADPEAFSALSRKGQTLFNRIETFPKPVIAAIHGAALGGGLELAMACHIRIADPNAKFGLPELQLGLIPGFAGTQRLPQLVGTPKATEMMLTSEPVTAVEANRIGLVNRVSAEGDVHQEALRLAEKIAKKSAVSVRCLLECLALARHGDYSGGMEKEANSFGTVFHSRDGLEGIRAFIEKRAPVFTDQ
ncbi:enoyl-CoA hydratase [Camelliibacillus cellulosilyticus]|uniref:Enoyl-CoA hydratase n=1 Tax=Camelliibacillus cellulosilyticus TaxID=2174486 RepID=A0ABV9GLY8_9BACL